MKSMKIALGSFIEEILIVKSLNLLDFGTSYTYFVRLIDFRSG